MALKIMDAVPKAKYKVITVNSPVSVEQVDLDREGFAGRRRKILIMGPTGAGKSTFIESLGLMGTKSISSNKLEGFTQSISTYRLNNVTCYGAPMYIIDSPGFADTKISEAAIVSMLKAWLWDNRQDHFDKILYFIPITNVRMTGSQSQVLKTFEALTGVDSSCNITIVTTMWDSVWGDKAMNRTEETFNQLRDDIWKEFLEAGAQIVKFRNNRNSSLSILDGALTFQDSGTGFHVQNANIPLHEAPFRNNLVADLKQRIENLQCQIGIQQLDLEHAEAQADVELKSIIQPKLEEAQKTLAHFRAELHEFLTGSLDDDIAGTVNSNHHDHSNDTYSVTSSPPSPPLTPSQGHDELIPRPQRPEEDSMSNTFQLPFNVAAPTTQASLSNEHKAHSTHDMRQEQGGWVDKIMHLMCCTRGKGVSENHAV